MGRPLKIKKIIETSGAGKDIGFNGLLTLTNPVVPSAVFDTDTEYLGVVGGTQPPTVATATYPIVKVRVFVTGFAEADGFIIRQKGSRKFLVADATARTALVLGQAYRITVVGDTDWAAYGAPSAQIGTIFTATSALADTGTGRVNAVGTCVLTSDLSPTAGNMSISYFSNDSTETAISKLPTSSCRTLQVAAPAEAPTQAMFGLLRPQSTTWNLLPTSSVMKVSLPSRVQMLQPGLVPVSLVQAIWIWPLWKTTHRNFVLQTIPTISTVGIFL
jgi:hypothetical protein